MSVKRHLAVTNVSSYLFAQWSMIKDLWHFNASVHLCFTVRSTVYALQSALRFTLYSPLYGLRFTVHSTVYALQSTLRFTLYSPLYALQSTLRFTLYSPLYGLRFTVCSTVYALQSALRFTLYSLLYGLRFTVCSTVYGLQSTLWFTLYSLLYGLRFTLARINKSCNYMSPVITRYMNDYLNKAARSDTVMSPFATILS